VGFCSDLMLPLTDVHGVRMAGIFTAVARHTRRWKPSPAVGLNAPSKRRNPPGARPVHPGGASWRCTATSIAAAVWYRREIGLKPDACGSRGASALDCSRARAMWHYIVVVCQVQRERRAMDSLQYERYQRWRTEAARLRRVVAEPPVASRLPAGVDVAAIRKRLGQVMGGRGISQAGFAKRYGFSLAAVRAWEQGLRTPDVAARVLLLLIDFDPHLVDRVIDDAIEQAAADRARVEVEVEMPRPSSVPLEVVRLVRKLPRKQRGVMA